jgi:hypothetical protein
VVTLSHADFDEDVLYVATVAAADLAGNQLAGNAYQWAFTTVGESGFKVYLPLVLR